MPKKRNGEIDFLRFFFSIIIVFYHFNLLYDYGFFPGGNICVEYFFLVSGYLMAVQIEKMRVDENRLSTAETANYTWKFISKKIGALYAYYISVVLLQVIVQDIMVKKISLMEVIMGFYKSIPTFTLTFMGMNYKGASLYVGNTWFLSAMLVAMFILYPILLRNYKFASKLLCPLLAMGLIGFSYTKYSSVISWEAWSGFCYMGVIRAFTGMSIGIGLRALSVYVTEKLGWLINSRRILIKSALTFIKIMAYAAVMYYIVKADELGKHLTLYALLFFAIGVFMSFTGMGYTIPGNKLTSYLGLISLPIFIYHGFIRWTISYLFSANQVTLPIFFAMIVGSSVISIALMYFTDLIVMLLKKFWASLKKYA